MLKKAFQELLDHRKPIAFALALVVAAIAIIVLSWLFIATWVGIAALIVFFVVIAILLHWILTFGPPVEPEDCWEPMPDDTVIYPPSRKLQDTTSITDLSS